MPRWELVIPRPTFRHSSVVPQTHDLLAVLRESDQGFVIHPNDRAVAIRARPNLAGSCLPESRSASRDDMAFVLGLHVCAAVAERKMPLAAGRADHGVDRVVVSAAFEPGQKHFEFVDRRINHHMCALSLRLCSNVSPMFVRLDRSAEAKEFGAKEWLPCVDGGEISDQRFRVFRVFPQSKPAGISKWNPRCHGVRARPYLHTSRANLGREDDRGMGTREWW